MDNFNRLEAEVGRLRRELADVGAALTRIQPPTISSAQIGFQPIPQTTSPSVVSQIRNGEYGHSVNTWNETTPALTADKGKECAFWFTHDAPFTGQVLDVSTTALTNSTNKTLKAFIDDGGVHSTYNANYCDWDRSKGEARLHGTKSLDAPFPSNRLTSPSRKCQFLRALIAKRNSTIVIHPDLHIWAGVWDKAANDWVRGKTFTITGTVRGTPTTFTERRYRVRAFTDRGYQYLSDEITLIAAPSDSSYTTADVQLTWKSIPGILRYEVYRLDVVAGVIRVLAEDVISNTYIDNNTILKNIGGYPSATDSRPRAYVATASGDLDDVATDGEPWTALVLNIPIPDDYDLTTTTAEQVLRVGMDRALDRRVEDAVVVNGSATVESPSAAFTSLDNGRTVSLSIGLNNLTTTITVVDFDTVTLATPWPHASGTAVMTITEGGDHGILLDVLHVCYVPNSAFAPYPDDMNRLDHGGQNPVSAPRESSQGGVGGGSGPINPGEGSPGCIPLDLPLLSLVGSKASLIPFVEVRAGQLIESGNLQPNTVMRLRFSESETFLVRSKHGVEVECSPEQRFIRYVTDSTGVACRDLRIGDSWVNNINGRMVISRIVEIVPTGRKVRVGIPQLSPGHVFFAGRRYDKTILSVVWRKIVESLRGKQERTGALHNLKPIEIQS